MGASVQGGKPLSGPRGCLTVVLAVVGVLGGLLVFAFGTRWLAVSAAPWLFLLADGDHARLVAILLALWALMLPAGLGVARVAQRRGRAWAVLPGVPLVLVGLFLFGTVPGRNNDGRLSRSLSEAVGGGLAGTGEVFVSCALAGILGLLALGVGGSVLAGRPALARWPVRLALGTAYVVAWAGIGLLVVRIVGDTEPRGTWLDRTAEAVEGGDAGVTGGFAVGLDPSVLEVVDCERAAAVLRVDGEEPELGGCRKALLVSATGRHESDGARVDTGELVAVVVQVRTDDQLARLDDALTGVELAAGEGLPQPPGQTLATTASAALSVVVAAEDTGDLPLPAEGAGRRPLTRALAYALIGTTQGFYLAPPDEAPAR